ncbi:MAG: tRNA (guanosine(37)-N1)-methyltransferase TrmD [candidate division KSB1 bacterium]|nr:tRNA (guanosine(37)-N1)-methyltransferase TrmD [candidate division KSB1 bacterium]MDZ7376761.1 tRNA (guanosine(37)-N1)-methyltransferase TrmD [candidate division KSB1 bacterium]MDZ7402085.1 tRNA (guanosine(37)-N1)-methyltransferase TrmD [candidate division KSB1 bacterium]
MKIHVITAFPNLFVGPLDESIIKRAREKQLVEIYLHDLRDYSSDRHRRIDDYPYGGGPGMILKAEPIFNCIESVLEKYQIHNPHLIYLTPQGQRYNQAKAKELAQQEHLILLCGHYKGVDERVREFWQMDEISIGDYVLTGGELPALVIIDSVVRLIPGAISDLDSAKTDSFYQNLLDCPYYTRPEVFRGMAVPSVLLSGHHAEIEKWRKNEAIKRTLKVRPDLLNQANDIIHVEISNDEEKA